MPAHKDSITGKKLMLFVVTLTLGAPLLLFIQKLIDTSARVSIFDFTSIQPGVQIDDDISYHFFSNRIQLWYAAKCLGSSNGVSLEVVYCDPRVKQTFHLSKDGKLIFEENGKCVQPNIINSDATFLQLGDCRNATKLILANESYLQFTDVGRNDTQCISPVSTPNDVTGASSRNPDVGALTALFPCKEASSRVTLIEEKSFLERRKFLLLPLPKNSSNCDFPACAINKKVPAAKLLPPDEVKRCYNLSECVTLITKTARRPMLVLRLAQSVRDVKGYDLPIIAYDDGVEPHSDEIMEEIAKFPNLRYIIGDEKDLGIALGRTLAVELVTTKYFILFDDDIVLNKHTDLELLAEILDTTDASLVGGKFEGRHIFAGYLLFGHFGDKKRRLAHYRGQCQKVNEVIPNFPTCMSCDITANVFMAKTKDVLEVGGWSRELKIIEHKDLFLRLKAAGKKVVYCPKVTVYNKRPRKSDPGLQVAGYKKLRVRRQRQMRARFSNVWNVNTAGFRTDFNEHRDELLAEW